MSRPRKTGQKRLTIYLDGQHAQMLDALIAKYRTLLPDLSVSAVIQIAIRNHDVIESAKRGLL